MTRRGFFAAIAAAVFGRKLLLAAPPEPTGITIRLVYRYGEPCRMDVLYGIPRLYRPELSCRVQG